MSAHKSIAHDSGPLHVTGAARYIDDIPMPANTLHLAFGLSTIAHGDITSIDLDPVRNADDIIDVITADGLPAANDVSPSVHDEVLLSDGSIHYHGQPIFIVVATSHLAARHAAKLAKIEYAEKPALLSMDDALAAKSQFEDPMVFLKGTPEDAIKSAAHTFSGSMEIGGQEHFYLEGQAAAVLPQDNGDMLVHSSSQHPTEIQHKVAEALDKRQNAIRIEVRRMGGGFGGKESQGNALAVACAVVAAKTGQPCKMRYDRDDDMIITGKRHEFRINYTVGFNEQGQIAGVEFEHFVRCGWAQDLSLPVADRAMLHADNTYHLPHARITSHRLKTNTVSNTAYRGFGGPQGIVGIERVIDHIAHHLKIDAAQVREVNYYDSSQTQTTPYHMEVTDSISHELVAELLATSDYQNRRKTIDEWNAKSPILKRGLAVTPVKFGISFTLTHLNQAGALVHVYADGSIHLNHGGTEMGQGLFTKVAQVAAEVFGVDFNSVKITATDTAKVPNTSATAASSGADLNGMAVKAACEIIKARMIEFLGDGYDNMSFAEAASAAYQGRVSLSSTGFYKTPDIKWDRMAGSGQPFYYFAYGAAVSEVVIDTLTGENRILRTDILHDAGKSLNPALDIGQVEGGYVQGAGWLTTEELVWDDQGRLRTHAPSTYKIPACSDRPDIFNVALWSKSENPAKTIYRSKAVGEPPFNLGISVLLALSDAISACGDGSEYVSLDAPATAERVLFAVQRQRDGA